MEGYQWGYLCWLLQDELLMPGLCLSCDGGDDEVSENNK